MLSCWNSWNYLRMRGEYKCEKFLAENDPELPPRARRILRSTPLTRLSYGTTSACAENTMADAMAYAYNRNYLRVRGEYQAFRIPLLYTVELPPRARRIP